MLIQICLKQCSATVPLVCVSLRGFLTPYNLFKGNVCKYSMLVNERSVTNASFWPTAILQ